VSNLCEGCGEAADPEEGHVLRGERIARERDALRRLLQQACSYLGGSSNPNATVRQFESEMNRLFARWANETPRAGGPIAELEEG
jgi:hypothetical protein